MKSPLLCVSLTVSVTLPLCKSSPASAAAFMTWLFLHWAIRDREWSLHLLALACFGVGTFMLADRWLQRKKRDAALLHLTGDAPVEGRRVDHDGEVRLAAVGFADQAPVKAENFREMASAELS